SREIVLRRVSLVGEAYSEYPDVSKENLVAGRELKRERGTSFSLAVRDGTIDGNSHARIAGVGRGKRDVHRRRGSCSRAPLPRVPDDRCPPTRRASDAAAAGLLPPLRLPPTCGRAGSTLGVRAERPLPGLYLLPQQPANQRRGLPG